MSSPHITPSDTAVNRRVTGSSTVPEVNELLVARPSEQRLAERRHAGVVQCEQIDVQGIGERRELGDDAPRRVVDEERPARSCPSRGKDPLLRVPDPPAVVVEGVRPGGVGRVRHRGRWQSAPGLGPPQSFEPIGGNDAVVLEEAHLAEAREIAERRADPALDDREALVVDQDVRVLLGAELRPDLTREKLGERCPPPARSSTRPSTFVASEMYRKVPAVLAAELRSTRIHERVLDWTSHPGRECGSRRCPGS